MVSGWRGLVAPVWVLLAACSPEPSPLVIDGVGVRTVLLAMVDEVRFEPDQVEVQQGETVRFIIKDETGSAHEVYIGTAMEQAEHVGIHASLAPEEQGKASHYGYGVHIPPHDSGEVVYRFAEEGSFYVGCHYPGHYEAGMRVAIEVHP